MQCGPCLPARPQVSQGPFFRGSLRRGHTSPLVASCFGQTMTLAGTWCQLAAAVAKALTSCMQRGVILLPRKLQQPGTPHSHMVFGAPLNSAIPSHTDHMDFPGGSDGKESACNAGDLGLIPGLGRSPGGGHGNPLQYSCLENPHGHLVCQVPYGYPEHRSTSEESVAFLQTFTLCP